MSTTVEQHECFTVASTVYLRNLTSEDLHSPCFAVHYQAAPKRDPATKTTSLSLKFPTLLVTNYLDAPEQVAERVAAILNKYLDAAQ